MKGWEMGKTHVSLHLNAPRGPVPFSGKGFSASVLTVAISYTAQTSLTEPPCFCCVLSLSHCETIRIRPTAHNGIKDGFK